MDDLRNSAPQEIVNKKFRECLTIKKSYSKDRTSYLQSSLVDLCTLRFPVMRLAHTDHSSDL